MSRPPVRTAAVIAFAALAFGLWRSHTPADERAIRARLDALRSDINATAAAGVESVSRAAQIGSYFTDDAVVDFGRGATPIAGRATLTGMVLRLQPRTAAFRLELDDVGVEIEPGGESARVTLTASFIQRNITDGEESRDAREFLLALTKTSGIWHIAGVTAIDTLR